MKSCRPFPITKITRPNNHGLIPSDRLFRPLAAVRRNPITWITVPARFGKTSLIPGYLDYSEMACLWYRLDEGDADIATVCCFMGLAETILMKRRNSIVSHISFTAAVQRIHYPRLNFRNS